MLGRGRIQPLSIPEAPGKPGSTMPTKRGAQAQAPHPLPSGKGERCRGFSSGQCFKIPNQTNKLGVQLSLRPGLPGRGDLLAHSRICVCCIAKSLPGLLLETIASPGNFTQRLETTFLMPSPAASGLTMRPRNPPYAEHVRKACR